MDYSKISIKKKINNIFIIPNSYPIGRLSSNINSAGYENRNVFLFVGTLNYGPNSSGLEWFMESIFPYIQKVNRSSILLVVGRDPEEKLMDKCNGVPGIELHANVPDVGPFYERCGIVVVPILSGGGTRIKILEAGMAGRPVFSTPYGAYGLDVRDGKNIMIFDDRDSFIERYELMDIKETYENIKDNLRKIVETKYSTESFDNGMKEVMNFVTTLNT
jgi:glycosyltransferase involved in cell wall biosynthesis